MHAVTIYTTPTCIYCKMAKTFFKKHGIDYKEKDVASDTDAQEEMIKKSDQLAVPVIDIDSNIVVGFDEGRLRHLLDIKA